MIIRSRRVKEAVTPVIQPELKEKLYFIAQLPLSEAEQTAVQRVFEEIRRELESFSIYYPKN